MKQVIAWLFGAGLVMNALVFVPQALRIRRERSARGVSLLTFAGFNAMQLVGTLHGYFQHDPMLMLGMLASFLTCGAVTLLACLHRDSGLVGSNL